MGCSPGLNKKEKVTEYQYRPSLLPHRRYNMSSYFILLLLCLPCLSGLCPQTVSQNKTFLRLLLIGCLVTEKVTNQI